MWVTQSRSSCRLGKGKTRESIHSHGQPLCKFISNKRKRLHKTRVLNSHRFGLKHQYGHRDVTNSRVWITLRFYVFTTECSHKSATTHKIERSGSPELVVVTVLLWKGVNCLWKINELQPAIRVFFFGSNGIPLTTAWQTWECSEPKSQRWIFLAGDKTGFCEISRKLAHGEKLRGYLFQTHLSRGGGGACWI